MPRPHFGYTLATLWRLLALPPLLTLTPHGLALELLFLSATPFPATPFPATRAGKGWLAQVLLDVVAQLRGLLVPRIEFNDANLARLVYVQAVLV